MLSLSSPVEATKVRYSAAEERTNAESFLLFSILALDFCHDLVNGGPQFIFSCYDLRNFSVQLHNVDLLTGVLSLHITEASSSAPQKGMK